MAEKAICKGHSCSFRHNKGQLNHQWACIFLLKLHCQLQPVSPLLVSSRKTSIYKLISRCTLPEESLQDGNKTQPEPDLKYHFPEVPNPLTIHHTHTPTRRQRKRTIYPHDILRLLIKCGQAQPLDHHPSWVDHRC